jgi:hypothetical protein
VKGPKPKGNNGFLKPPGRPVKNAEVSAPSEQSAAVKPDGKKPKDKKDKESNIVKIDRPKPDEQSADEEKDKTTGQ